MNIITKIRYFLIRILAGSDTVVMNCVIGEKDNLGRMVGVSVVGNGLISHTTIKNMDIGIETAGKPVKASA